MIQGHAEKRGPVLFLIWWGRINSNPVVSDPRSHFLAVYLKNDQVRLLQQHVAIDAIARNLLPAF